MYYSGVRLSVCPVGKHRDSPGDSMWRGQRTFRPDDKNDRHIVKFNSAKALDGDEYFFSNSANSLLVGDAPLIPLRYTALYKFAFDFWFLSCFHDAVHCSRTAPTRTTSRTSRTSITTTSTSPDTSTTSTSAEKNGSLNIVHCYHTIVIIIIIAIVNKVIIVSYSVFVRKIFTINLSRAITLGGAYDRGRAPPC